MGRILVFLLLAVLVVPAVLLWRLWREATQRRVVNEGTLGFVTPTIEAERTMARWPARARVVRSLGLLAGLAIIVLLALRIGTLSVFLWPLALLLGYLLGVVAGEFVRPRPQWRTSAGSTTRLSDYISPGLVWSMRGGVALTVLIAGGAVLAAEPAGDGSVLALGCPGGGTEVIGAGQIAMYALLVLALAGIGWLVSELTLWRLLHRPVATELDDVPVDEALRSASAHSSVAAATTLILLLLGGFSLVTGVAMVGGCAHSDLVSVTLVAAGFAALLAGLLVAAFLPRWLRPVLQRADVRS